MSPEINKMALGARPSPTMGAAAAGTSHPDPISLAVGEPSDAPAPEIVAAAERAARDGLTRYGAVPGLKELRETLAKDHEERYGIQTTIENVVVTAGGKPALIDAMRCILEPGDEVVVPLPAWPTFLDQPRWCGGEGIGVPATADLLPDPAAVAEACSDRAKILLINSPGNPTGRVWPEERMKAMVDLAIDRDLWILSDEVYRSLSLIGPPPQPLSVAPEAADRTIVVTSFSKQFSMTGYRIGSAIGPAALISAITHLMSTAVTHASMLSQYAALAALHLDGTWETTRLARHRRCRNLAATTLDAIDGISLEASESGLYAFPDASEWITDAGFQDDAALCAMLREDYGLMLVPGSAFGSPGRFRLSWCIDEARLEEALGRLKQARAGR
ncbi:MAG: hypothetical protein CMJ83_12375 [Planctomycetes bacterium]|nr:hypothetical protein [Planctomycetota bacterium]